MSDTLQEEAFFEECRQELLSKHPGKYALVKGSKLIGVFDTGEEADANGTKQFGESPFLVKKIEEKAHVVQLPSLQAPMLDIAVSWLANVETARARN